MDEISCYMNCDYLSTTISLLLQTRHVEYICIQDMMGSLCDKVRSTESRKGRTVESQGIWRVVRGNET